MGLKSKIFGQESTKLKDSFLILSIHVSLSKMGYDFSNKVVFKFTLEKKVFNEQMIYYIDIFHFPLSMLILGQNSCFLGPAICEIPQLN